MMALMMGKLYLALKSANVSEDVAREASEEVAQFDNRLADMRSDIRLLKWIGSVNTAGILAILAIVLQMLLKH